MCVPARVCVYIYMYVYRLKHCTKATAGEH